MVKLAEMDRKLSEKIAQDKNMHTHGKAFA
jgi:hypothetical protein